MKTIITKNVCVSEGDITIHAYPGVFAISLKSNSQIQVENRDLDILIKLLRSFKEQREMEHTLKDIIVREDIETKPI
jgi:hypothetical protein